MQFFDALDQLADIRRLVMRAATFRGFRSSTTFSTALLAMVAGIVQWEFLADGQLGPRRFALIWSLCAAACAAVMLWGALLRLRRFRSQVENDLAVSVAQTLMPSLMLGALVTLAAVWLRNDLIPLLPSWWMILMSVGIFGLRGSIGRIVVFPAAFYGACGLLGLVIDHPLGPFWMAGVFATGQTMSAIALRVTLERNHGS